MPTTRFARSALACAVLATALVLGPASAARSAERFTPPLEVSSGGLARCTAVNVSGSARSITIEVRDSAGNLVAPGNCTASNPVSGTVGAGDVSTVRCSGSGFRYCRFAVDGARKTIRGVLRATDAATATVGLLAAE